MEENDPFKNAMMFWKMCPHHYTNEDLYQAFISRMIDEGYIRKQMNEEEYAEWNDKMVTKHHPDLQK